MSGTSSGRGQRDAPAPGRATSYFPAAPPPAESAAVLEAVFRASPAFLHVLRGPDFVFEFANEAYYRLVGRRDLIGRPAFEALPEAASGGFQDRLARVLATREPFEGRELPVTLARTPGAPPEERLIDLVYLPLVEGDGSCTRVLGHGTDVTEHVRARRRSEGALAAEQAELAHTHLQLSAQATAADRAREAADAERARAADVLERMADAYFALDAGLRVVAVNAAMERSTGLTRAELLGRDIREAFPGTRANSFEQHYRRAAVERAEAHFTHDYSDGRLELVTEVDVYPASDGGVAVFWRDVTSRTRTEAALRASEARHAFLLALSDALRPLADPVEIQEVAARTLGEYLGVDRVAYVEYGPPDRQAGRIHRDYRRDPSAASFAGVHHFSDHPAAVAAVLQGRPFVEPDVGASARLSAAEKATYRELGVGAIANLPLAKGGVARASIIALTERPRAWTDADVGAIRETAERTWDAVERARAESALTASEGRLRLALDVAELGTWTWDLATGAGDLDARGAAVIGLPAGGLVDVAAAQFAAIHPDDLAPTRAAAEAGIAAGEPFDLHYRVVAPDGRVRHVASRASVVADAEGRPVRLVGTNRDVTAEREAAAERARLLAELGSERERLRSVVLHTPAPLALTEGPEHRFTLVNEAYRRVSGGGRDVTGLTPRTAFPELAGSGIHELFDRVYASGEPWLGPETLVRSDRDGAGVTDTWFDLRLDPVHDAGGRVVGILNLAVDVTGQVRARRAVEELLAESERARADAEAARVALAASEVQFRTLADAIPTLAWTAQADGYIDWYNARWYEYTGTTPAQMEGWGWQSVHDPAELPWVLERWRAGIASGQPVEMTFPLRGADGRFRPFLTRIVPLRDAEGRVVRWFGTNTDVTPEREARAAAERAQAAAEAANRSKGEFLAVMSHELRTPLNAIGGYAELLELGIRGPVTEAQRADLARIQQSQRHLLGLINQVLNYTRIDAGAVRYDLVDVRVAEALGAAEALVLPQARARRLTLVLGDCAPHVAVRADGEKLQQVLLNLLTNAVKFTEPGGEVRVACAAREGLVAISVADTGVGISPDKLAGIFEPFVQVDQRLTRPHEGVGLGLAISRELARGMGGDLTAESTTGVGSTFALTLPAAPVA